MDRVRLLLSPSPAERRALDAAELASSATGDAVRMALSAWRADCLDDPEGVAVLYAAGHGIWKSPTETGIVLLQDFGVTSQALLENALDITKVYAAMGAEGAPGRQFYFVDACRVQPDLVNAPMLESAGLPRSGWGAPPPSADSADLLRRRERHERLRPCRARDDIQFCASLRAPLGRHRPRTNGWLGCDGHGPRPSHTPASRRASQGARRHPGCCDGRPRRRSAISRLPSAAGCSNASLRHPLGRRTCRALHPRASIGSRVFGSTPSGGGDCPRRELHAQHRDQPAGRCDRDVNDAWLIRPGDTQARNVEVDR